MPTLKGQEISVDATGSTIIFGDAAIPHTLVNDDVTNSVFFRAVSQPGTFTGNAATLKAAYGSELKPGERATVDSSRSVQVVCVTGKTATLRVVPGVLGDDLHFSATGALEVNLPVALSLLSGGLLVNQYTGTIKYAKIDCASAAAAGNTLVAAVAGKKIRVLAMFLTLSEETTIKFYSGAANTGTALTGAMSIGVTGGFSLPKSDGSNVGYLETVAGEALTLLLGAAKQASGAMTYCEV